MLNIALDSGWSASGTGSEISLGSEGITLALTKAESGLTTTIAPRNLEGAVLTMVIVPSAELIASGAILQPFAMVSNLWKGKWCDINITQLSAGVEQTLSCTLVNDDIFAQTENTIVIGLQAIVETGAAPELAGTLLLKHVAITLAEASSSSSSSSSNESSSSSSAPGDNSSNETLGTAITTNGYSLAPLNHCGEFSGAPANAFSVFADYNPATQNQSLSALGISGWNHTTNGKTVWGGLSNSSSHYALKSAVNSSCNDVDTINMVLIKKIANWDEQHSNGFERGLTSQGKKFGDVNTLLLDMKVNSASTQIATVAELKATYAGLVNNVARIDELDAGKVNIGITLRGNTSGNTVWNAAVIVEVDQANYSDQWVRISIPLSAFSYYSEANYARTTANRNDFAAMPISNITVVGETRNGAVLRGNISSWNDSNPPLETFKEMDISFKKIEFELK